MTPCCSRFRRSYAGSAKGSGSSLMQSLNRRWSGTPDPKLIKLLVRAHRLKEKLRASPGARIADLAIKEKLSPSYIALLLRLTFLAPDITRAILEGCQPGGFTAQQLVTYSGLPVTWPSSARRLAFA